MTSQSACEHTWNAVGDPSSPMHGSYRSVCSKCGEGWEWPLASSILERLERLEKVEQDMDKRLIELEDLKQPAPRDVTAECELQEWNHCVDIVCGGKSVLIKQHGYRLRKVRLYRCASETAVAQDAFIVEQDI